MSDEPRRPWGAPDDPPAAGRPGPPFGAPTVGPGGGSWPPGPARPQASAARGAHLRAALRATPPRRLAAHAALAAAALVTLAALALLVLAASGDFELTLGDRLRLARSVVALSVPVLLVVALALRERDGTARTADLASVAVGGVATALLTGALLADLFGNAASAGIDGAAGRLATVLTDLAAVVLAGAVTWWALQRASPDGAAPAPPAGGSPTGPPPGR